MVPHLYELFKKGMTCCWEFSEWLLNSVFCVFSTIFSACKEQLSVDAFPYAVYSWSFYSVCFLEDDKMIPLTEFLFIDDFVISCEFTFRSFIKLSMFVIYMSSLMHNELWLPTKGFPTLNALTRLLSCMCSLMCTENWFLREGFPTFIAPIGFLSWMSSLMYNELRIPNEGFSTLAAFIWFLSCVHSLVYKKA